MGGVYKPKSARGGAEAKLVLDHTRFALTELGGAWGRLKPGGGGGLLSRP